MPCTVEILSVGNELLLGNTVNTNASWIAANVTSLGGAVSRITTVPDNLMEVSIAIRESLRRKPDYLITTGGIGPTFDDMTFRGVAKALKVPLRVDKNALAMVREHYARRFPNRKVSLTRPRRKMAQIPVGAMPVRNPVGTAPGVRLTVGGTQIFCLPGVPKEAKAIFRASVSKAIRASSGGVRFAESWFGVRGIMESSLAPIIDRVMRNWPGVYIKSHPRGVEAGGRPFIELHFSISSSDSKRAERILHGATRDLKMRLKDFEGRMGLTE